VLLAPTQTAYAEICALITRARLAADKGTYRLTRADFQSGLDHCLALWVPPAEPRASTAGWLRELFPGRCWIAIELHLGADDAARLARLQQLGAAQDVLHRRRRTWIAVSSNWRRAHAFAGTTGAAGYGHCDPSSLHAGGSRPSLVS